MIDTEAQPATKLPRDAKPSELVRGWPEDRWCRWHAKKGEQFCAGGILAEMAGFNWTRYGIPLPNGEYILPHDFLAETYDIPDDVIMGLPGVNDFRGKDAAADYLEAAGF